MGARVSREQDPIILSSCKFITCPNMNSVWATALREAEKVMVGYVVHNLALEGRWGIHDASISVSLGCVCCSHCLIAPYFRMGI
jgi:hypothetical protein